VWLVLGAGFRATVRAQEYSFGVWTTANGLPQNTVTGVVQTPDLSGRWVTYNDKAAQFDKPTVITQNGVNLSIDNGYGAKSTAVLVGRTFTTSDGLSGTVTPDGTRID
jgi:hypothetical protein